MSLSPKSERERRPIPNHPYRDSALLYGFLALIVLVLAALTGGSMLRALVISGGFWLVATGWSSWKFRARIRARDSATDAEEGGS